MPEDAQPSPQFPSMDEREAQERIAEWLLVHSVTDLKRRSEMPTSYYAMVGISHVLRRLFLDEHAVVAWSRRRLAIPEPRFEFSPWKIATARKLEDGRTASTVLGFARSAFVAPTVRARTDNFLAASVGQAYGTSISVRDLIDVYANVLGGIHTGRVRTPLHDLIRSAALGLGPHSEIWARTMQHVAQVAARGLEPVAEALRDHVAR